MMPEVVSVVNRNAVGSYRFRLRRFESHIPDKYLGMTMTYLYKTKPFDHQHEEFTRHGAAPARGLWWEPGTGKTKPVLDSAAYLFEEKEIDGLMVIAPNGVHRNWVSDEIPAHLPDRVAERARAHVWYSNNTKTHQRSFNDTLSHNGLAMLMMSFNAVLTKQGQAAWKAFLKQRRCLYVIDESHRIKSPNAKWSKRILGSKAAAPFKRVLTGTPAPNSPFDMYNQIRFLDPDVWRPYGIQNFAAFKTFFGIWEQRQLRQAEGGKNRFFPYCVAYKNLDVLYEMMHRYGARITKDECLDLPPKVYSKRYFKLTPQQKRLYEQLRDDCVVAAATGDLTVLLALVKLLRFQQITCGYLPGSDDDDTLIDIPGGNPRLDLLVDTCQDLPHQVIIWARFQRDIDLITNHKFFKNNCTWVDGRVTGRHRDAALDHFKAGKAQFLIGNPSAIGEGHTLTMAKTAIYYSNSFNLKDRIQSEDRPHRPGQDAKLQCIDLVAEDTVDIRIIDSLRKKLEIASLITGDNIINWI